MKKLLTAMLLLVLALPLFAQGSPPQGAADQPYTVEYYFKAVDPGCRVKQKSNRRAHVGVVGLVVR